MQSQSSTSRHGGSWASAARCGSGWNGRLSALASGYAAALGSRARRTPTAGDATPGMNKLLDDCFLHDKDRLRHGEALAILKSRIRPVVATETVNLADAPGRILAAPAAAVRPVPAHTNAA